MRNSCMKACTYTHDILRCGKTTHSLPQCPLDSRPIQHVGQSLADPWRGIIRREKREVGVVPFVHTHVRTFRHTTVASHGVMIVVLKSAVYSSGRIVFHGLGSVVEKH